MTIVNGRSSTTREWRLLLAPRHTGDIAIPAIRLGDAATAPIMLKVLPAAQAGQLGQARPVLLDVESGPDDPYVQGQVVYTVRVLSRVPLREASLSEPRAAGALIERLGEDRRYTTERDGREYQVIERRYAIFPQHSGKLEIDAPVLVAQVPDQDQRRGSLRERFFGHDPFADMRGVFGRDPFGDMDSLFERTRPVRVRGRKVSLDVQPQPAGTPSPWLPAESLTLAESWSPDPPSFRVGEPVTRTIAITAQGLTAAQLPESIPGAPEGVKVYADRAQTETRAEGDTLVVQKLLKAALVPNRPGELTLPEVRVPWWDTGADRQRVATLPARTVQVLPGPAGAAPPTPRGPQAEVSAPAPAAAEVESAPAPPDGATDPVAAVGRALLRDSRLPVGYWPWVAAFLAVGWLATLVLLLRVRRGGHRSPPAVSQPPDRSVPSPAQALAGVRQACRADDPRAARRALLEWAAARWPEDSPRRLETLAQRLGGEGAAALRELDRRLYADTAGSWDGRAAWQRLSPFLTAPKTKAEALRQGSPLPSLYPREA
jgi:hypothetical protein